MNVRIRNILRAVQVERPNSRVVPPEAWPDWVRTSSWEPSFVLSENGRFLAVAVEWSGTVPRVIYRQVVQKILETHPGLSIMVCIPTVRVEQDQGLAAFCRGINVILRAVIPSVGTEEITAPPPHPRSRMRIRPNVGQFPQPILDRACNLPHLCFSRTLTSFARSVSHCVGDDNTTLALVKRTIDELLQSHPFFRVPHASFMRLASFEHLLTHLGGETSDHVFHSFRVFLAGCPIVSRFYDQIRRTHRRLAICTDRDLRVEYSWLIAALFHDIGRVREGMRELIEQVGGDDFNEVRGSPQRWGRDDYQQARRVLGSLGAHVAAGGNARWDGGACEDNRGVELSGAWINLYNSYTRHGVIGAFDLLADVLSRMPAASERKYRPFTVSHVAPAAIAVLLHDWRVWEPAKDWGLFPVHVDRNPLASLLIYLDTWDDFKRRPDSPPITISDYVVDDTGATVFVEWSSKEALEREQPKYRSFSQALTGGPPSFRIEPRVRHP